MSDPVLGGLSVLLLVALVLGGMPVGFALIITSLLALILITGSPEIATEVLATTAYSSLRDYIFAVLPLFVLMGAFMSTSDAARGIYAAAHLLTRKVRGGLAIATVYANAVFAAVTGVSIASAAVFSTISLPEMKRHGYDRNFSLGVVAGTSVLGMLIPPSLLLILYGVLTGTSIGALFIAGILPGVVLAAVFTLGISLMVRRRPELAGLPARAVTTPRLRLRGRLATVGAPGPRSAPLAAGASDGGQVPVPREAETGLSPEDQSALRILGRALPLTVLIVLVLGGIWSGVFTPTEASAVGAVGACVLGFFMGLTPRTFVTSFVQSARSVGSLLFVLIAASIYARALATSGLVAEAGQFFAGLELTPVLLVVVFIIVLVLAGMILDSNSILLIAIPIMFPVAMQLGLDPIWFGIVAVVAVEVGLLTPPFGMVPFAMASTLGKQVSVEQVFRGAFPFVIMMFVFLALLVAVPSLATFLPSLM